MKAQLYLLLLLLQSVAPPGYTVRSSMNILALDSLSATYTKERRGCVNEGKAKHCPSASAVVAGCEIPCHIGMIQGCMHR